MEALLVDQQEIIQALRTINLNSEQGEEMIKNLEEIFVNRLKWHFDVAAQ